MSPATDGTTSWRGDVRTPGGPATPAEVRLGADGLLVTTSAGALLEASYRDLATVAVDGGVVLVVVGDGASAERWLFERFGPGLAAVARGLRDGRLRQWLTDALVEVDADAPIDLVEWSSGGVGGVAQLVYDSRGAALAPLDERVPRRRIRRADIGAIEVEAQRGRVRVEACAGEFEAIELSGLGPAATSHGQRWQGLRDGAAADVSAILSGLLPDAPFDIRRRAQATLREGRPVSAATLGEAWPALERAVLVEPTFAESYATLVERGGGPDGAPRWLAVGPEAPGTPEPARTWFLVGLPANLVALELVSAGAHATYLFRVADRATYRHGDAPGPALEAAVREISEALLDARFLREPMALAPEVLAKPEHLRYRLALASLPSLAAARARFVARLIHRDDASWAAALDEVIAWHGNAHDEAAEWPGRRAQDALGEPCDGTIEAPPS